MKQQPNPTQSGPQFPTLAQWTAHDPAAFKRELDSLAAAGRGLAGKPAAQRAVQEAVKVLNDLYRARHG